MEALTKHVVNATQKHAGGGRELKGREILTTWGYQTGWSGTCLHRVRSYVLFTGDLVGVEERFHFWIFDLHLEQ